MLLSEDRLWFFARRTIWTEGYLGLPSQEYCQATEKFW